MNSDVGDFKALTDKELLQVTADLAHQRDIFEGFLVRAMRELSIRNIDTSGLGTLASMVKGSGSVH